MSAPVARRACQPMLKTCYVKGTLPPLLARTRETLEHSRRPPNYPAPNAPSRPLHPVVTHRSYITNGRDVTVQDLEKACDRIPPLKMAGVRVVRGAGGAARSGYLQVLEKP